VRVKGLLVDEENNIRKLRVIQLIRHEELQPLLSISRCLKVPRRTRIRIQLVNILQVILSVAPPNDVELSAHEGHGVAGSHLGLGLVVGEVVAVGPGLRLGVKGVEVVETLGVGPASAEEIKLLLHRAERHTCAGGRALTPDLHLAPPLLVQVDHKQIV
jgi:hypothetical protein